MLKVCRGNKLISDTHTSDTQLLEECSIPDSPLPLQIKTIKGYLTHKSELFRWVVFIVFCWSLDCLTSLQSLHSNPIIMAETILGHNINNANNTSTPQNKTPTIVAAGMLRQLDPNLLKAVQRYFAMEADAMEADTTGSAASSTESVTGILTAAKKLSGSSDSLDSEITPDTICCFNASGQMLCSLLSFDENTYKLLLPTELKSSATYLSPVEKVKLLSQLTYFKNP